MKSEHLWWPMHCGNCDKLNGFCLCILMLSVILVASMNLVNSLGWI